MRRILAMPLALLATLSAACGSGSSGGGGGIDLRTLAWAIQYVPTNALESMFLGFRNLDIDPTTVDLQGFMPDGTPYAGPVTVNLDGNDETHLSVASALGGSTPAGGWIRAITPSMRVEVFSELRRSGSQEAETTRAAQLSDLTLPPAFTMGGLTTTFRTESLQITNVAGVASNIDVTPYEEPQSNPDLPPIQHPTFTLSFNAFETKTFDPDGLSGISSFFGSFFFSSANPFSLAALEDLAIDTQSTAVGTSISGDSIREVSLRYGREVNPFGENLFDFVMTARNDSEEAQTLAVQGIFDQGGTPLIAQPLLLSLDPHESRVVASNDSFLAELALVAPDLDPLRIIRLALTVPGGVDVSFRQFDPVALGFKAAVRPLPIGHVFDVSDLRPDLPGRVEIGMISNPFDVESTVTVEMLIPEPEGFDATILPLIDVTVPPRGVFPLVIEGTFLNRDLEPVPFVGARFSSLRAFGLTVYGEERDPVERVVTLTTRSVGNLEDARH